MEVLLVAYPDCLALDLIGPSDVFCTANSLSGSELYRCIVVAEDKSTLVRTESGVRLLGEEALISKLDKNVGILLVGGGDGFRQVCQNRPFVEAIAKVASTSTRVVSVCAGAFVLAEAGLLVGHRVTTHWSLAAELATKFPDLDVVPDEIYVDSGKVMTSAGVTAGIDLALAIVALDHGDDLARAVARQMVVYLNRSGGQSQFSERQEQSRPSDPGIEVVVASIVAEPSGDYTIATMAGMAHMSERHFTRQFKRETGTTPGRWVERVRVDRARREIETTDDALPVVATRVGFRSYETMRQAFERVLKVSPARYRKTH